MTQNEPQIGGEVSLYVAPDGRIRLDVRLERDTVWLTQAQMPELFGRERSVITKHINNVFKESGLDRDSVCANFAHTAEDGKTYSVQHFNLDVIISVGYRVKSHRGVQFRIWATQRLREYIIAANLSIEPNDFEYAPFSQQGGLGKVHQLFGDKLNTIIEELNETLAA